MLAQAKVLICALTHIDSSDTHNNEETNYVFQIRLPFAGLEQTRRYAVAESAIGTICVLAHGGPYSACVKSSVSSETFCANQFLILFDHLNTLTKQASATNYTS